MKIEFLDITELKEYENNAKEHPQEQVQQIAYSIEEFGFNDPIAIDENNIIIEGHGRLLAAKLLEMEQVPVIRLAHLSDTQKRAYVLAHNKLTMNTGFDQELLLKELTNLFESGFDLMITGFDEHEIEELGIGFENKEIDYDKANDVPDVKEDEIVIKEGDLIELGEHRLLCGDATSKDDVLKLLSSVAKEKTTKHFISDPPYGIGYDPKIKKYGMIKNDDTFLNFIPLAKKYTDGFFMIWTSYQVVDEWIKLIKKSFDKITNMIVWHKGGGGLGDCAKTLATDFEIALVHNRGNHIQADRGSAMWQYQPQLKKEFIKKVKKNTLQELLEKLIEGETLWRVKKDNTAQYLHPTQKPVEINERALINFTKKNDIVVDFFLGSGSNLIACENLERRCFGMELDTKYAQTIIERYIEYTSIDVIKINKKEVSWSQYKQMGGVNDPHTKRTNKDSLPLGSALQ